jgi:hypothetical protein
LNQDEVRTPAKIFAEIQALARGIRQGCGVPLLESCAQWCEVYAQMAQWSLGEKVEFASLEDGPGRVAANILSGEPK